MLVEHGVVKAPNTEGSGNNEICGAETVLTRF
jgi:hypothetical protein